MAGRRIRDEGDARACLASADASGLGRAAWARRHGVDGRSLNAWRLNLARRIGQGELRPPVRLVELVPTVPMSPAPRYLVRCGRFEVELDDGFEEEVVERLLRVVAGC